MYKQIIKSQSMVGNQSHQGVLNSAIVNQLLIFIRQGSNTTNFTSSDLDDCNLLVVLRRADGQELTLVSSDLLALANYSNYSGGYSYDATGTDKSFNILLNFGRIVIGANDQLVVTLTTATSAAINSSPVVSVYGVTTDFESDDIFRYLFYNINGSMLFKKAVAVFCDSAPDGTEFLIQHGNTQETVLDYCADAFSDLTGKYESNACFYMLFLDQTAIGQDVTVILLNQEEFWLFVGSSLWAGKVK